MRLIRGEGVERFFNEYVKECEFEDIYYLTISKEATNPFNSMNSELRPSLCESKWDKEKGKFCWISAEYVELNDK